MGNKNENNNDLLFKNGTEYIMKALEADAPFCLFVASNDGHSPFTTGDLSLYPTSEVKVPSYLIDTPKTRQELAKQYAEVSNLDALLGRYMQF